MTSTSSCRWRKPARWTWACSHRDAHDGRGHQLPWPRLAALIAERTGLHFPPDRYADLQRGLQSAAAQMGYGEREFADWLLSAPLTRRQMHVIAGHFTVGGTYFFRERRIFEALAAQVIPELVDRRGQ